MIDLLLGFGGKALLALGVIAAAAGGLWKIMRDQRARGAAEERQAQAERDTAARVRVEDVLSTAPSTPEAVDRFRKGGRL